MLDDYSHQEILKKLVNFYHSILLNNELSQEYLKVRGITVSSAKRFLLGYTYGSQGHRFLSEQNIQFNDGLFLKKNNIYVDAFSNRIIFPIMYGGNVISLTSRAVIHVEPPHLHLSGSIPYFYNHDIIRKEKSIVVVESPIDCIILNQNGFPSIATMGTNSIKSKKIIHLTGKKIYICFDQDNNNAGLDGAVKFSAILKEYKIFHRMIVLPRAEDGKNDVAKYFKTHNREDFQRLINDSVDIRKFKKKEGRNNIPLNLNTNGKLLCPFHKDSRPSLVIYYDTQSYYCFGCGKYGPLTDIKGI